MSTPARDKTRYQFELVDCAEPDSTPVQIRLRKFLKSALRQWSLKCIGGRILDAVPPGDGKQDETIEPADVRPA